jgi:hypothetical protein
VLHLILAALREEIRIEGEDRLHAPSLEIEGDVALEEHLMPIARPTPKTYQIPPASSSSVNCSESVAGSSRRRARYSATTPDAGVYQSSRLPSWSTSLHQLPSSRRKQYSTHSSKVRSFGRWGGTVIVRTFYAFEQHRSRDVGGRTAGSRPGSERVPSRRGGQGMKVPSSAPREVGHPSYP